MRKNYGFITGTIDKIGKDYLTLKLHGNGSIVKVYCPYGDWNRKMNEFLDAAVMDDYVLKFSVHKIGDGIYRYCKVWNWGGRYRRDNTNKLRLNNLYRAATEVKPSVGARGAGTKLNYGAQHKTEWDEAIAKPIEEKPEKPVIVRCAAKIKDGHYTEGSLFRRCKSLATEGSDFCKQHMGGGIYGRHDAPKKIGRKTPLNT